MCTPPRSPGVLGACEVRLSPPHVPCQELTQCLSSQGAAALVPTPNYAVFNNQQSRELIKSWAPKFVRSSEPGGSGLTPSSTENMQRFVRHCD